MDITGGLGIMGVMDKKTLTFQNTPCAHRYKLGAILRNAGVRGEDLVGCDSLL